MKLFCKLLVALILGCFTTAYAAGKATHVVVVVFDGMRPDFMTPEYTPNLYKMATEGTTFKNHHPVYISTTEVNGTAIATGCYPGVSTLVANTEYRPDINLTNPVATEAMSTIRKADKLTDHHYLQVPTMAETLQANGLRTIVAGTKPVAALQDRSSRSNDVLGLNLFEGVSVPHYVASNVISVLGKFPALGTNKVERDTWTGNALIGPLWEQGVPALTVLWLGEPDGSQHATVPGSKLALDAIKNSDAVLGRVLSTLEKKGLRDQTDVMVISDHGFSTVNANTNVVQLLKTNGFNAVRNYSTNNPTPKKDDILVVGGPSTLFYVNGHDPVLIEKLVHFLQAQPFCGVVFSKQPIEGAFPLQEARIDCATAPDVIVSMRWKGDKNKDGAPGLVWTDSTSTKPVRSGTHGSLSAYDMHNICFAAGPDFRKGVMNVMPSGNVDIAPTVLWLLGVEQKVPMSGRVLSEALVCDAPKLQSFQPNHIEATYTGTNFVWRQYVNYTEVNGTRYFDEGNGAQTPAGK